MSGLLKELLRAQLHRSQDGGEAVDVAGVGGHVVTKSEPKQMLMGADEFVQAFTRDDPVHLAGAVVDRDAIRGAAGVGVWFALDQSGHHVVIVGQRLYTVDELCEHGHLHVNERAWMGYFAKYLQRIAASVGGAA